MRGETSRPDRFELTRHRAPLVATLIYLSCSWAAASAESGTAPQLPQLLEAQGWRYQSDANGNVYYHPPQPTGAAAQPDEAIASALGPADVKQLLLERGWQMETNAQGDILLLPVSAPAPSEIDQMLRERGWRILTDVDGNTLLMPTGPATTGATRLSSDPQPRQEEPAPIDSDQPAEIKPAEQFRQALEEKGWTVSSKPDGSMVIYPPEPVAQATPIQESRDITEHGYCKGITLVGEEFQRPIDAEAKAQLVAGAWIAHFGQATDMVGKARKLDQVFVVSIVESKPPHTLRNQLIIREDGSIVALH